MKYLLAVVYLALLVATPNISRAEDITRFAPLKADELTPPQKAWADMIAAPPRNAKFVNPIAPISATPIWRPGCRPCRTICAGIRRCRRA
jgi:hypothetical protein